MVFVALAIGTLVSEDLACITAGLLIREGRIGFAEGVGACALGILLGDVGLWAVGSVLRRVTLTAGSIEQDAPPDSERGWRDALAGPAERWLRRMRPDDMRRWLESNAAGAIVGSRFLPGTRLPLYVCAGMIGLPLATFAGWASVAVLLWTPLVVDAAAMAGGAVMGAMPEAGGPAWASRAALAVALLAGLRLVRWLLIAARGGHGAAWLARWSRWEFWPMWLFYAPVAAWVALLSLRYRGLSTITASNPGIEDGGVVGESKFDILSKLPADAIIPSAIVPMGAVDARVEHVAGTMRVRGWRFPLVLKPDVGQRGVGVKLARDDNDIRTYCREESRPILVQPYHPGPFEAGIFYYRHPGEARGRIFSITDKHFPVLIGDGRSTLEALIRAHPRYRLQASLFLARHCAVRSRVPGAGERVQLAIAGNHAQGTLFRRGMHLWTPALERRIDEIARALPGFHVGRFDVRYEDVDQLRAGQGLAIVELNGATAESTDIYDPAGSLIAAYRTLFRQWAIVFAIGSANRAAGAPVSSLWRLASLVRAHLTSRPAFVLSD